jgi:hypothetical protein
VAAQRRQRKGAILKLRAGGFNKNFFTHLHTPFLITALTADA